MTPMTGRFQLCGAVILIGVFGGGLYNGHRHTGHWPIPDGLILISLLLYVFMLVRRVGHRSDINDMTILGIMAMMILADVTLAATGYGERPMASLGVLPLLLLALYLGAVDVYRRRDASPTGLT